MCRSPRRIFESTRVVQRTWAFSVAKLADLGPFLIAAGQSKPSGRARAAELCFMNSDTRHGFSLEFPYRSPSKTCLDSCIRVCSAICCLLLLFLFSDLSTIANNNNTENEGASVAGLQNAKEATIKTKKKVEHQNRNNWTAKYFTNIISYSLIGVAKFKETKIAKPKPKNHPIPLSCF